MRCNSNWLKLLLCSSRSIISHVLELEHTWITDHTTPNDYSFKHTKPILNQHKLLTLNNIFVLRSPTERI